MAKSGSFFCLYFANMSAAPSPPCTRHRRGGLSPRDWVRKLLPQSVKNPQKKDRKAVVVNSLRVRVEYAHCYIIKIY